MMNIMPIDLVQQIDALLPQTQCTRCGYPSCKKYAEALAANQAEINQCPPGGDEGIVALSQLLSRPVLPLNPANGTIKPRQLVVIDEDVCIGCTLCIKACPVDAIVGANKMLHTVITSECTGCDLCIPACPVDCIHLYDDPNQEWSVERRDLAKSRFDEHQNRREREQQAREERMAQQAQLLQNLHRSKENCDNQKNSAESNKTNFIADIMARAQQKK
ncbi:MAG: electron transport complex subunit RsxB [Burkholderiales bacterium]|nr:electron transport complex subunit RsxB [Burkholderiales bacterium]